ncbi:MAG: hypothetical protein WD157_00455 [Patescibacteria group bacterium]
MFNIKPRRSYVIEADSPLGSKDFPEVVIFDQIIINAPETELKTLRQVLLQFQQQPSGELRLLVINGADNFNELSQNTLLKIIEEPPSHAAIILQVRSVESLLPTLRSRLQRLSGRANRVFDPVTNLDVGQLYLLDRPGVIEALEQVLKQIDLSQPSGVRRHQFLNRAVRKLKQNVNTKLTLDWLDLNWNQELGIE